MSLSTSVCSIRATRFGRASALRCELPRKRCLAFSGLRATELCELKWSAVNLDRRTIYVPGTKSKNAGRTVNIVDGLLLLLIAHYNNSPFNRMSDYVFPTAKGTKRDQDNLRTRIVERAEAQARELIAEDERQSSEGGERRIDVELPRDQGGAPDARVLRWMDRPEPQARPSRLRLVG